MTVEEKVYALLSAAAAVTVQVPAARIKPPGDWQDLARPYIVHAPINGAGETVHTHDGGLQALRIWHFYCIEIYAQTTSQARAIAELVIAALDGHSDSDVDRIALASPPYLHAYDTDRKVAQVSLDFEIGGALD